MKNIRRQTIICGLGIVLFCVLYPIMRYKFMYAQAGFAHPSEGLYYFYEYMEITNNVIFSLFLFILSAHFSGVRYLTAQKNHFSFFEIVRLGWIPYHMKMFILNFMQAFFVFCGLSILTIVSIHFFCSGVVFENVLGFPEEAIYSCNAIVSDYFWNMILFIILSALGYSIFSQCILSMVFYIRNLYAYRACGLMIGMLMIVIPALCNHTFSQFDIFWSVFFLPNIISLGVSNFGAYVLPLPVLLQYIVTILTYCLISGALWMRGMVKAHAMG